MYRLFGVILVSGIMASLFHPSTSKTTAEAGHYPEELPGAFTGGFGEQSCHSCHFDYPLNPKEGSLSVAGIPGQYQSGKAYEFTISLKRNGLEQAGFQLSSRFEDGTQAGSFKANSNRLSFTEVKNTIQYLQHSAKGANVQSQEITHWNFTWVAPDSSGRTIILNLAANAGNGDASAFGDYIFLREIKIGSGGSNL